MVSGSKGNLKQDTTFKAKSTWISILGDLRAPELKGFEDSVKLFKFKLVIY